MITSKKRKKNSSSKELCKCCGQYFSRLSTHYYHSELCKDFVLNNDKTLVSDINVLEIKSTNNDSNNQLKKKSSLPNFDYHHTNDQDDILFEEIDVQSSNSSHSSNESIKSTSSSHEIIDFEQNNNDITFNNISSINNNINQIDYQINSLTDVLINEDQMIQTPNSINKIPFYFDFTTYQMEVYHQMIHLPIDNSTIASVKLLKIMLDGHLPSCHYSKIIQWHNETLMASSIDQSMSQVSLIKSKKRVIKFLHDIMFKYISPSLSLKPVHSVMTLPSQLSTKISKINVIGSIFSLLTDPELMKEDNIYIHDKTYRKPNECISKVYKDIHHSESFKNAHRSFCVSTNDILVPIIPFIDGTPIDPYGRNNLEVVMFTLGIFNQSTRNKPTAWRVAGYVPDPTNSNTGEHIKFDLSHHKKAVSKRIDYHEMLSFILDDFVKLEQSDGILFEFPNKEKTTLITYRLKFVILYVIGDAVGNDKLCDRFANYGKAVTRLCRDCDCPSNQLNNPKHCCTFTKRSELLQMSEKSLKEISYYKINNNAMDRLSFGNNKYGLNGCLPPEPLHQLNQGVFKKLLDYFDDCITAIGKDTLNSFVRYLSMNSHRQSTRDLPNISIFKDGIDKCQLTGSEIINKVFMLYLCLIQTYIIESLPKIESKVKNRFKTKKTKSSNTNVEFDEINESNEVIEPVTITKHFYKKIGESRDHLKLWITLFEATLCFDAWVHQDQFDMEELKCTDESKCDSKADMACREYLKLFTKLVQSDIGNGTNTSKVHWILHIPHYIRQFGPPKAYSGQTPEHCLSPLVKWAARLTQLRPSSIIEQSCERYFENHIIQRSVTLLQHQNAIKSKAKDSTLFEMLKNQSKERNKRAYSIIGRYRIYFDEHKKFTHYEWKSKRRNKNGIFVIQNQDVLNDIIQRFHNDDYGLQCNYIDCFTTLNIVDVNSNQKDMYRADPYFYKRPWNDWCLSKWTVENSTDLYPSRILLFVDTTNMTFTTRPKNDEKYIAIVRASENDQRINLHKKNKNCMLIESFEADKYVRMISCDSIVNPVFVIPDVNEFSFHNNKHIFKSSHRIMIRDKNSWPDMFINTSWL